MWGCRVQDMDDIDYMLPQSLNDFGNCMMQLLSTLIFISVIQPWFLCGVVPLMVVYFFIQKFYRRSYVELQRNDAVTRSPLYAHFSETLSGVDTIRAYALSERFADRSDNQVDFNHRCGRLCLVCLGLALILFEFYHDWSLVACQLMPRWF